MNRESRCFVFSHLMHLFISLFPSKTTTVFAIPILSYPMAILPALTRGLGNNKVEPWLDAAISAMLTPALHIKQPCFAQTLRCRGTRKCVNAVMHIKACLGYIFHGLERVRKGKRQLLRAPYMEAALNLKNFFSSLEN